MIDCKKWYLKQNEKRCIGVHADLLGTTLRIMSYRNGLVVNLKS